MHVPRSPPALLPVTLLLLWIGLGATAAAAQEPYDEPAGGDPEHPSHTVAITFSPLHLLTAIFEVQAEFPIGSKFGVSGIAGYGQPTLERKTTDGEVISEHTVGVVELGAQGAYYVVGTVDHGMQLGAELLYVHLDIDETDFDGVSSGVGEGLAIGPFLGYKLVTNVGFTLHVQLGVQYAAIQAEATSTDGDVSSGERDSVLVLLNIGTGWAF